jgi:antitoxin PrlF
MSTTLNSKGRLTVPRSVRDYLGLRPGSVVTFERLSSGEIVIRADSSSAKIVTTKLRGRANSRMTTEEIMALTRGD